MDDDQPKYNRVVAYVRKSSEDDKQGKANKQLNSLEYQREFIPEAINKYHLKLIHSPFEDDKSGYEAFQRPNFDTMLDYIRDHKGEVDGIVCTEISRLARNFGDGGMILWYLQNGNIKRIYTPSKIFTDSSSDQLMVAIEFAMSKKSSDDTGYRTKAGMKSKVQKMKHPARPAILGYLTQGKPGAKEWVIDPVVGPLVKQVFEQFSTGQYSFEQIAEYAYNIGIRSKSSPSGKHAKNTWSNRLRDRQYTGIFDHDGERIVGAYEPLIDSTLFYQTQEVISVSQHPKDTHLHYAYSPSFIKCGLCGDYMSGTVKKGIIYYRCGKRKSPCKDLKRETYVPEDKLEQQLIKAFQSFEIDQKTWEVAREYANELNQPERINLKSEIRKFSEQISSEERALIDIGRKYSSGGFTKSEYERLRDDSVKKQTSLRNTVVKCENIVHELDELMSQFLDNIKYVTKRLDKALPYNKRELVDVLCENLTWKDKKLGWDWKKPYYILANKPKSSTMLPG